MKKGSTLLVILASLAILCLLGLAGFVTLLMNDTSSPANPPPVSPAVTESESDSLTQLLEPGGTVISNLPEEDEEQPEHAYIFVGDSRTVGMHTALTKDGGEDSCTFIAKSGEGFYWLYHDGIVELEEALRAEPHATVIFNLGVNDLTEVDKYLDFYKELFSVYHDPSFYLMSVNPVVDGKYDGVSNENIEAFNEKIEDEFPDKYLDSYHYLLTQSFETVDGLHYTDETYRMIHRFVVQTLEKNG